MRPVKIEFKAFGPYKNYEIVDFDKISSQGLFLICGKTGVGKTMIIDAMTFALYGKSSGSGRDSFGGMRCQNADDSDETFVKFEFEHNGKFYIFERRQVKKRVNFSQEYNLLFREAGEQWQVVFENPKESDLNKKAVEIIGLEYEQFRQVIVLPQGQFERLLVSKSDEKEKILQNIFGEALWQKIAESMYEKASERKANLDKMRESNQIKLEQLGCNSIEELENKIKELKEEMSANVGAKQYLRKEEKSLKKERALLEQFEQLDAKRAKLLALEDKKEHIEKKKQKLKLAKRANNLRPFVEAMQNAKDEYDVRIKDFESAQKQLDNSKQKLDSISAMIDEHKSQESSIAKMKNQIVVFSERRSDYAELSKISEDIVSLESNCSLAKKEMDAAELLLEKDREKLAQLNKKRSRLSKELDELWNIYLAGITGEIASKLEDNKPCPVCGSLNHPNPASVSSDKVTKVDVDRKDKELKCVVESINQTEERNKECDKAFNQKKEGYISIKKEYDFACDSYNKKKERLVDGIASEKELDKQIEILEKKVQSYTEESEALEKKLALINEEKVKNDGVLQMSKKECEGAKQALEKASEELLEKLSKEATLTVTNIHEYLLGDEELDRINKEVNNYDKEKEDLRLELENVEKSLEEFVRPDSMLLSKKEKRLEEEKETVSRNEGGFDSKLKHYRDIHSEVIKSLKEIEEKYTVAEDDLRFAKNLRGDTGTGIQRYVLGIMFSSVVDAANKMLELVHDGRYRMYRTDDKGKGNKKGLELKVIDKMSHNEEGRFVNTLSGGEKFLASLALSIGMSTVAGRSGIKIEALFIDEGFGSLDEASIADAMNVLNTIQKSNGIVGIISHVQLLQERISSKLIVESDKDGSHIKRSIG